MFFQGTFLQNDLKISLILSGEDFLSFHYSHIRQNSPPPGGHVFPRNISTKWFENQSDTFRGEDFLSFHYSHIRQNCPAPWRPCFLTNQHGLKESDRGSSKDHLYKIIWKSANQFGRRRIFFFLRCHGNQNFAWIPKVWRNSGEDAFS